MRLEKALTDSVISYHDDFEWIQPIDYEHVPFHYRKFHAHGHLFRDCPLNASSNSNVGMDRYDYEGFTKVSNHKKHNNKPSSTPKNPPSTSTNPSTSNSFDILANHSMSDIDPRKTAKPSTKPSTSTPSTDTQTSLNASQVDHTVETLVHTIIKEIDLILWQLNGMDIDNFLWDPLHANDSMPENIQPINMEEEPKSIDIGDLDIFGLEQACKKKEYYKINMSKEEARYLHIT